MMNDNPDITFSDGDDDYNPNQKELNINEIILRHLRKIGDICCTEFTGGYWQRKPIKTAGGVLFTEEYHEDVRQAYCNAVDFLIDIIYPKGDKELQIYLEKHEIGVEEETDITLKRLKKRRTFQEINKMFERNNFFNTIGIVNE